MFMEKVLERRTSRIKSRIDDHPRPTVGSCRAGSWCGVRAIRRSRLLERYDLIGDSASRNFWYLIYLLTATGLSHGGRSTVHIYTQIIHRTIHRATQQFWNSAGRAPSWLVIPWHLPYNRGKSTEKPQSRQHET